MLFNSINFAFFLPLVFALYWFLSKRNASLQNALLLFVSYFFYACWDWRFLFLLLFSTLLDYFTGFRIQASLTKKGKLFWLWLSIFVNLGLLGFFKYFNFFVDSFADLFATFGISLNVWSLNIILPIGISFYTFHGLSYIIDIYYERIKPEKSLVDYSLFVSYFPLLVAGPIERAQHLLPQIKQERKFNYAQATDGCRQIMWGLFKKIVIADQCALRVNDIFENYHNLSGLALIFGAVFFAFQIYCDFSGYSDIALGTSKLFGINLLTNFKYPYFSRNIAEFWRRWHISLSSWFRDYVYIPLGGSKGSKWITVRNIFIIFLLSGFWHGANWTFLFWGFLNAVYILPSIILKTNRKYAGIGTETNAIPSIRDLFSIAFTFALTVIAWIFFRSDSLTDAFRFVYRIVKDPASLLDLSIYLKYFKICALLVGFVIIEWLGRMYEYPIAGFSVKYSRFLRWSLYYFIVLVTLYFAGSKEQFIYFQF